MPLKRTYSSSTTIVPSGYQQTKRRNLSQRSGLKRLKRYPINGTVGKPRPFPIRMVATLKYFETLTFTASLTSVNSINIACNSIYDPNLSGTGHQPYGHDTYAGIYNQYTVLNARIRVKPVLNTSTTTALTYGVGIEDTVVTTTVPDTWAERPTYVHRKGVALSSVEGKELTLNWNRAKRFPHEDLYRTVSAPFGANPSELEVFNVVLQNSTGATLGTCYVMVEIDYTCEFYELKDLGSS